MAAHIEHFTHEIDFVQQEDGSWRADGYPSYGAKPKTSRVSSYPSRAALLTAFYNDREFWRDAAPRYTALGPEKKGVEHNG